MKLIALLQITIQKYMDLNIITKIKRIKETIKITLALKTWCKFVYNLHIELKQHYTIIMIITTHSLQSQFPSAHTFSRSIDKYY